jgi:hypothetical protein
MVKPHALVRAARDIAAHLIPAEKLIDDSFSHTARFLASLPDTGRAAGLPGSIGHEAMMKVLASLNAMAHARGEMIAAHAEFTATRHELRLPETGFGSLEGCPASANLSIVGREAA